MAISVREGEDQLWAGAELERTFLRNGCWRCFGGGLIG